MKCLLSLLLLACLLAQLALAQRGPRAAATQDMGPGMGMGGMNGMGMGGHGMMGHGGMGMSGMGMGGMGMGCGETCPGPTMMSLLQQHSKIQRQYKHTDSGIDSLTTSDDPQVAALIKAHVKQMRAVLDSCAKGQCSHTPAAFDPLFRAVYANADKLDLQVGVLLLLSLLLILLFLLLLLLRGVASAFDVYTL
jgi:hypothetical protein